MRPYVFIGLYISAVLLEANVTVFGLVPAFVVVLAYWVGLRFGPEAGLGFGLFAGVVADSMSGGITGPYMLGYMTAGYLASFLHGRLFRWTPVLGVIGLFCLTFVGGLLAYWAGSMFGQPVPAASKAYAVLFAQSALNCALGAFIKPGGHD